jgi:hypothetical protein
MSFALPDPDTYSVGAADFLPRVKELQHEATPQLPHVFMASCLN